METSMVERSRILCWDTLYIAVKENTTKTMVKNDVFFFFYKRMKKPFRKLGITVYLRETNGRPGGEPL